MFPRTLHMYFNIAIIVNSVRFLINGLSASCLDGTVHIFSIIYYPTSHFRRLGTMHLLPLPPKGGGGGEPGIRAQREQWSPAVVSRAQPCSHLSGQSSAISLMEQECCKIPPTHAQIPFL